MNVKENIEFIEEFLAEGNEYIKRRDPVQASEKLYKVVEECIKALAEKWGLPEYDEAKKGGRWWSRLLTRAARRLARETGEAKIKDAWAGAFDLHVWGFHEHSLDIEDVKQEIPYVEWLLNYTREILKESKRWRF